VVTDSQTIKVMYQVVSLVVTYKAIRTLQQVEVKQSNLSHFSTRPARFIKADEPDARAASRGVILSWSPPHPISQSDLCALLVPTELKRVLMSRSPRF
jgi:hypothetical protein